MLPITFSNPTLSTYDGAGTPACYNDAGNIQLPGTVQMTNGRLTVSVPLLVFDVLKDYHMQTHSFSGSFTVHKAGLIQIGKTKAMVTLQKNSFIVGYLCKEGKSASMFLSDSYWSVSSLAFIRLSAFF